MNSSTPAEPHQPSLFDDDALPASAVPVLGVPGSAAALTKAQKQFNKLIAKIAAQRELLRQWEAFVPVFQRRLAADIEPMNQELRGQRIAMAKLLDRAMDHKAMGKTHRAKVQDILLGQLSMLLNEVDDPALVAMYDRHSETSFADVQREEMDMVASLAGHVFGVDVADDHGASSAEELARLIGEQMQAEQAAQQERAEARPPSKRAPSAKAQALQSAREQAAKGATAALRGVYRQLVSELHPDREPDAQERKRKTTLMQQANQAYDAGDLLALLELQLRLEQIEPGALANLAQERLAHFNHVLDEQLNRLQEQLEEITEPFAMMLGSVPRQFTPDLVHRAIDSDMRNLAEMLDQIREDLVRFEDIKQLKASLRHYRIGGDDDIDEDLIDDRLLAELMARRR